MKIKIRNKNLLVLWLATPLLIIIGGCSIFNETRFEKALGQDVNLIEYAHDIADDLIDEAYPPLAPRQPGTSILTTTFVDNNDLLLTSQFGRLLQEHIGSRFVQQGYTVKELKLRNRLHIEEKSGETILSRQLNLIKGKQDARAILIGTISHAQRTMYISARLVNPVDATIISSKSYRLYMDKNVLAMYNLRPTGTTDFVDQPDEPLMNSILY